MIRLLASALFLIPVANLAYAIPPGSTGELDTLRPEHPRLIATADDWTHLKDRIAADPELAAYHAGVIADARALLKTEPVERKMIGRRLLNTSRTIVYRTSTLGYAWRMTGDAAFAQRAEAEMLAAAAFSDWNPSHFLDVAEATAGMGIGYDWCYDALTPESRAKIRHAIVELGLKPGSDPTARTNGWQESRNNWNQVCFGGLAVGALAIAEDEPELADTILSIARAGIGNGLAPYAPDGVYPEGPSYWSYGTSYQVLMIAALESALGTDWGIAARDGFLESAGFVLQGTSPSGLYYNFADGREGGGLNGAMFWFARKLGDPGLLQFNWRHLDAGKEEETSRFSPLVPLWWPEAGAVRAAPSLPQRWLGRGLNPLGVFRESWTNPDSLYLAFKGGAAELNHAHMDAGSFILEANGVRWGIDLGLQEYESLESKGVDLWNRNQDSQRWQVFRLNNFSHSTLTIDAQHHRVDGHATITHFSDDDANPGAIVELSPVFSGQASKVRRGFKVLPDRRVLIQDELSGLKPGAVVRWQMPTRATVSVDGGHASLAQDGKMFHVEVLFPDGIVFRAEPASPPADGFNAPNPGVTLLYTNAVAPESGALRIAVVLSPGDAADTPPAIEQLDNWFPESARVAAPKPLYRDPVFDGAADPSIVYDRSGKRWLMFYTNRRANVPGLTAVTWVHGTPIGIAESVDGSTWTYAGDVAFPRNIPGTDVDVPTYWAPAVVDDGTTYHMFVSIVPGVFGDWQHPRNIVHLTSGDLRRWKYEGTLPLVTDKVIDACVLRLPDGTWRLWYNNERDGKKTYYADSPDLYHWTDHGAANLPRDRGEAPLAFRWKGHYWLLVDLLGNIGLGVYRSNDALNWERQPASLLDKPGTGRDDQNGGHHPEVVISGDRAYLFYFVHPGAAADGSGTRDMKRSSIQVTELKYEDGWLACDRDAPTVVELTPPGQYPNPLIVHRADPQVYRHADDYYYFMGTVPEYDRLVLRRAKTIAGLADAEEKVIWRKHEAGIMGAHIWAPEIHNIDGKWFVYFAAGAAEKVWNIRIYVLENDSENPLEGEWAERGQIDTGWESFALDSTTFTNRGTRYLLWAQQQPGIKGNTNLYIAEMNSPTSIRKPAVMLSKPEHPWEQVRYWVNEAPSVLKRSDRIFLTYSAAGTGAEYCLGMLTAARDSNLLDPRSWTKSAEPVFKTSEENGIFGPGHNSFTVSGDGKTDLLVYHARNYRDIQGDPLHDPNRNTRVQPIRWREDGTPDFGVPRPEDAPTP